MKLAFSPRRRSAGALIGSASFALAVLQASPAYPGRTPSTPSFANEPEQIPVGIVIPVSWEHTVSSKSAQPGQAIEARVMQDVPLYDHDKIPAGAKLLGTIVSVVPPGAGAQITFRFDKLEFHHQTIAVRTSLRAMASFLDVQMAQTPLSGSDASGGWATTVQIGGDTRFGDGGQVIGPHKQKVGKGVPGGVLVHIRANPALGCEGPTPDNDRLQALWVFSANACGVYDLNGVRITRSGTTAPLGDVTIAKEKDDLKIDGATAMLLRIVP